MPPTTAAKPSAALKPFTVEFGDSNCRNFLLTTLRIRVRGAWSTITLAARPQGPGDFGQLAGMPPIPGQQLTMNFKDRSIVISDPLQNQPEKLARATIVAKKALIKSRTKDNGDYQPIKDIEQELDFHTFKTLLIEIGKMLSQKDTKATLVKGTFPTAEEIENLPGDELYDMNNNSSQKPRFKKDSEEWLDKLDQQN